MQDLARSCDSALQISGTGSGLSADPVQRGLALRNVVESAVLAAPAGSVVGVVLSEKKG